MIAPITEGIKRMLFLLIFLTALPQAKAYQIVYGENLIISQPVYEDLYVAGGTVSINAPVHGDLIVAGGTIAINDSVYNDLLLAGGTVTLNGYVGDDIRCAGGQLRISKNAGGDVLIAGGTINIEREVTLKGLVISGGTVIIDGTVLGEIRSAAGNFVLNGTAGKGIDCRGGKITINGDVKGMAVLSAMNKLVIGNSASFTNDVRYYSPESKVDFRQSVKNGKAVYDESLAVNKDERRMMGFGVMGLLWYLGMVLIMIMLIEYLFTRLLKKAGDTFRYEKLKSLVRGFLFFVVVPVLAVLAFVSIVGLPVGFILLFGYILVLSVTTSITALVITHSLNNNYFHKTNYWSLVFIAFGIFILLKLVSLIPVLGWLVMLVLACIALGAVILNVKWRRSSSVIVTSD